VGFFVFLVLLLILSVGQYNSSSNIETFLLVLMKSVTTTRVEGVLTVLLFFLKYFSKEKFSFALNERNICGLVFFFAF
jgi:hypothetical protein